MFQYVRRKKKSVRVQISGRCSRCGGLYNEGLAAEMTLVHYMIDAPRHLVWRREGLTLHKWHLVGFILSKICMSLSNLGYLRRQTSDTDATQRCYWIPIYYVAYCRRGFITAQRKNTKAVRKSSLQKYVQHTSFLFRATTKPRAHLVTTELLIG
jgi:hypothetical protein